MEDHSVTPHRLGFVAAQRQKFDHCYHTGDKVLVSVSGRGSQCSLTNSNLDKIDEASCISQKADSLASLKEDFFIQQHFFSFSYFLL